MSKIKIDWVKVAKGAGAVLSIAGTLLSGWAGTKENTRTIEKMVNDHFEKK